MSICSAWCRVSTHAQLKYTTVYSMLLRLRAVIIRSFVPNLLAPGVRRKGREALGAEEGGRLREEEVG